MGQRLSSLGVHSVAPFSIISLTKSLIFPVFAGIEILNTVGNVAQLYSPALNSGTSKLGRLYIRSYLKLYHSLMVSRVSSEISTSISQTVVLPLVSTIS